jgi:hypothetical protein
VMHRELCTIWLDLAVGRPTKHWVNGAASEASASSYKRASATLIRCLRAPNTLAQGSTRLLRLPGIDENPAAASGP